MPKTSYDDAQDANSLASKHMSRLTTWSQFHHPGHFPVGV
jgi:hypothetical protein